MDEITLSEVEAIRVMRSQGNLRARGVQSGPIAIRCDVAPQVRKLDGRAEIMIASNAEFDLPPGVSLEVLDCGGNLEVEHYEGPLSLGRVRGNFRGRHLGSIAIRGEVDGEVKIEDARAIDGEQVNGNVRVETARAVRFGRVAGNAELHDIAGEVVCEDVLGHLRVGKSGKVTAARVAGKLQVEQAAALDSLSVGGKAKIIEVAGDVKLGKVAGRLSADDIGGNLACEFAGGHAGLRAVRGAVDLMDVAGAVDLLGPLPFEGVWNVRSRGRISVEIAADASLSVSASARRGRVRAYGVPGDSFIRSGERVEATLGAGGLRMNLEASDADIILFGEDEGARDYDCRRRSHGREFRFGRRFSAPFEAFADDLREDIPEFVSEIVGAAGRIVSESGKFTGGIAQEVTRSVGDAMREVERAIGELERKVPREVSDKLARAGRKIGDIVERAMEDARERRRGRERSYESEGAASAQPAAASGEPETSGAGAGDRDETLLKILKAVREGTLRPEEADDLISAWVELRRTTRDKHTSS